MSRKIFLFQFNVSLTKSNQPATLVENHKIFHAMNAFFTWKQRIA